MSTGYDPFFEAVKARIEARAEAIAEKKLAGLVLTIAAILWFWMLVVTVGVK